MIRVHHLSDRATLEERAKVMLGFNSPELGALVADLWERGMYDCVAHVNDGNLDVAFRATNTVDRNWWEDRKWVPSVVEPKFEGTGCRSTSVGDVMTVDDQPVYRIWAVAATGFLRVIAGPPRAVRLEPAALTPELRAAGDLITKALGES